MSKFAGILSSILNEKSLGRTINIEVKINKLFGQDDKKIAVEISRTLSNAIATAKENDFKKPFKIVGPEGKVVGTYTMT